MLQHHTPHIVEESIDANNSGNFDGVFNKDGYVRGEIAGARDCRISIREAKAAGSISGNKINASESQVGDEVWADSFIPWREAPGDDPAPQPGLSPANGFNNITINGEEMVDTAPGDTVTVDLVMPSDRGYSQIYWYLAGPNDSGLGNEVGTPTSPSGTGIETEVTHTFSMPSDASGVYTFTAYIYPHSSASDQTIYEYTIKIYCS